MDELGTILRETRQARGLTVEQVAQATRIRPRFLEALEEARYDVLPTPVHVRGFLRNYALFLNLDPEPLVARYRAGRRAVADIPLQKQVRPEPTSKPVPPLQTVEEELAPAPVFYRPLGNHLHAPAWFSTEIVLGSLVVIVLLALVAWVAGRFVIPAIAASRGTETPEVRTTLTITVAAPTASAIFGTTPTVQPPTPKPTIPPIVSSLQLEVSVSDRAWLLVEVDGVIVQEGLAQSSETFSWNGTERIKLRTGNAGGLSVILNGNDLGTLGPHGGLYEKTWGLAGEMAPTPIPTVRPEATPQG